MRTHAIRIELLVALAVGVFPTACQESDGDQLATADTPAIDAASGAECLTDDATLLGAVDMIAERRPTFRHETFGDEAFWGGELRLHEAIAGEANGGVGPGLSPNAALGLGLKVDVAALPPELIEQLQNGEVDLDDPERPGRVPEVAVSRGRHRPACGPDRF